MLQNIPQGTGKFPTTNNYPAQNVNSAAAEKLGSVLSTLLNNL